MSKELTKGLNSDRYASCDTSELIDHSITILRNLIGRFEIMKSEAGDGISKEALKHFHEFQELCHAGGSAQHIFHSMTDFECEPGHIDRFVSFNMDEKLAYAQFMFMYFRLPAGMNYMLKSFFEDRRLYCNYEGKRYRCTGASRFGDVWLSENYARDTGYDLRVDFRKCSDWSDNSISKSLTTN